MSDKLYTISEIEDGRVTGKSTVDQTSFFQVLDVALDRGVTEFEIIAGDETNADDEGEGDTPELVPAS